MINRRTFIKHTFSAGLTLGSYSLLNGCSGIKRQSIAKDQTTDQNDSNSDSISNRILRYASLAPSGHNSQPWYVRIEEANSWIIQADPYRRLPAVDPQNRELLLSIGAFVENLSIAAASMGRHAHIQVITQSRRACDILRVKLYEDKPVDYPLWRLTKRRTVKHGHLDKAISTSDFNALNRQTEGNLFYFPKGSKHANCIQAAAVENFRLQTQRDDAQKELVRWLRLCDEAVMKYRDGLSTEGMEITGFKGWLVRHFIHPEDFLKPSYREQSVDMIVELAQQGGGWMVLTSPKETVSDLIEAGRRFERMALLARELGIGIHPMTQLLEEKEGLSQLGLHHISNFYPQFVLRVGYLDSYPKPVTLRRPVSWFTTNVS
jgi:hypothetical protein